MQQIKFTERQRLWFIFFAFVVIRTLFIILSGFDNFELSPDSIRYFKQSDDILNGQYSLIEKYFITAPIYSYLQALIKGVFGGWWMPALTILQVALSGISGIYLYKLTKLLFTERAAQIAAAIYCVFPLTLWWVHTFTQDAIFQYLLIMSVYYLVKMVHNNKISTLLLAATLFSLTFLTKAHILLFSIFIPLIIWLNLKQSIKRRLVFIALYSGTCVLFTLPYGIYNYRTNGIYTLSSTGHGALFLIGHNDDIARLLVNPTGYGTAEQKKVTQIDNYAVWNKLRDTLTTLSEKQKQEVYFAEGLRWCRENPTMLRKVAFRNLYYFLLPGVNYSTYPFKQWLFVFIISFPLYLFAYPGIWLAFRQNRRKHTWIVCLFLTMLFFSVFFCVQNRFRTITIEPFYIVYAAFALDSCYRWWRRKRTDSIAQQ